MASIINATTAAGGGIIQSADASGVLELQAGGVTKLSISSSGVLGTNGLLNIQYFTVAGSFTYTPTTGTTSIVVEVVGGGGGSTGAGGTSSFGAFCSATGGATNGTGGAGTGGDLNRAGIIATRNNFYQTAVGSVTITQEGAAGLLLGFGSGASKDVTVSQNTGGMAQGAGAGGYSRRRITSGFSGTTVTVGAAGTGNGSGAPSNSGAVIVYEYT